MKSSPLFKGLTWLIGLNIIIKPIWIFGIDRQVQNIVGYEEYGRYFALFNLSFLLSFLADAGLTNMVNRRLAAGDNIHFKQLLGFKLALSVIYFSAVFVVAAISNISNWKLLVYLVIIQALTSFFVFLRSIITAYQLFITDAWLSVIDKLLMIIVCGSFLYATTLSSSFSLQLFLQVQTATILFSVLVTTLIISSKLEIKGGEKLPLIQSLKLIQPFTLILLLMSTHYRLDGFLLERLHPNGAYEAGVYASAYRLLDAGNMAGYLAASFLVPFIAKNRSDKNLVDHSVLSIRHLLLLGGIFITIVVCFFPSWLQQILYHSNIAYHSQVFKLCIISLPAYYLVHIYSSVLTASGRLQSLILIIGCSVLINAVLNIILIPYYGAEGSAFIAIISQYFCALACYIAAAKNSETAYHLKSIIFYLLTAVIISLIFYIGKLAETNEMLLIIAGGLVTAYAMFMLVRKEKAIIFIK